ncbi:sugar phosphate isomerase/epimerase family protein [Zunongwangia sp. HRR-M8]|uniref:sugar phosphate isomerase/epimerase family protein n=1 Tax=Zunongwangia sp. HRR-M8 TaxID=3015170 RepID=UPI0022DE3582|nr:sugar phosphate isomerase/epimerase [Zunongwangia sp. HRR-M8]WBL21071.1 sugar phosphate isomerase/epimerase [Zunongwangia sp. HRR-M8]
MKTLKNLRSTLLILSLLASFPILVQRQFGAATLYTVREEMAKSPEETIDEVADIGYLYIEAAGYNDGLFYGMKPKKFKKLLGKYHTKPLSSHQGGVTMENVDQMIADVKKAGFQYFVIPVPPMGKFTFDEQTQTMGMDDDLDFLVDIFNTIGEKCKKAGIELLYHNHDFEFKKNENGIVPIEYFLENTDPDLVNFQMDLFWVTKAGADPVAYFEKYPGRFKLWHVKDMDEAGNFTPVGEGTIDFERILEKRKESGMKYYIVEQDNTFDLEPLEAIKISHENLRDFGFDKVKFKK